MALNDDIEKALGGQGTDVPPASAPDKATSADAAPASTPDEVSTQVRGDFDARPKRKTRKFKGNTLWIVAGLLMGLCVAIGIIIWVAASHMHGNNQVDESRVKADAALDRAKGKDNAMENYVKKKGKEEQLAEEKPPAESSDIKAPADDPRAASGGSSAVASTETVAQPVEDKGIFPTVQRFQSGGLSAGSVGSGGQVNGGQDVDPDIERIRAYANGPAPTAGIETDGVDVAPPANRGSLSDLAGTGFAPSKARIMPSRKYMVTHNTYTRCALYTEIITDQPGLIECRLTEPLYSADGSVVIADAGDKLTGEQKVEVRAGQTRVFTSWSELETASGVRAQLNSLGAGPMGASGTEAWINNHYMQRFGGAVMLSFIQDALQSAANSTQKGGNGYTVNNSEQNVESMANKALENSISIPPTAYILPGTVMTVIVARDIDFSPVFNTK